MKHYFWIAFSALLLGFTMLDLTSCSKDEENGVAAPTEKESGGKDDDGNKDSGKEDDQPVVGPDVVVTVDDSGQADGGHRFQKIDETSFYIDDIKYTAEQGDLVVTGYNEAFFKGTAVIISTLKYQGRTMDVTSIKNEAFKNCMVMNSCIIGNKVTSIGEKVFYGCSGLTSVTIPSSVTSIGESAFSGCSGLASIMVENGNSKYDSRENCNAIIETATNTLIRGCKNTIIPNSVTTIGEAAFSGCSGLTSVTIPNSVTSIGACAFSGCSSLSTVTIGSGVTNIGDYAFSDCSALQHFYCYALNPPLTASNAFCDTPIFSATLHVPAESLDAYKSVYPWSSFGTGIQKPETVTWNFQVQDMQLAREMGLKIAYYDADGSIKTADVSALSQDGKFSVKVVADGTKAFKMGFVAVWFLNKPAEEYTAETYNFTSTIAPTIVRTYNTGDKMIEIGASPYTQTGTLKAQPKSFLQKRIDAGFNYVSTFFGYSYSDSSTSSISDKELLQALGAVRNNNN